MTISKVYCIVGVFDFSDFQKQIYVAQNQELWTTISFN